MHQRIQTFPLRQELGNARSQKIKRRASTELERESMSDDLMELNDTELIYINFGDKTDSDNASNNSYEDFVAKKPILF